MIVPTQSDDLETRVLECIVRHSSRVSMANACKLNLGVIKKKLKNRKILSFFFYFLGLFANFQGNEKSNLRTFQAKGLFKIVRTMNQSSIV